MLINFDKYEAYQTQLLKLLRKTKRVRVKTRSGTNISFHVRNFGVTPYKAHAAGEHALLHFGEVFSAILEKSAEGRIVYDTSLAMDRIKGKLKFRVSKGKVVEKTVLDVADKVIREFLRSLEDADENASIVGEFGIGLNPNAEISGCIMEDESVRGTCHIDLGDNTAFGGENRSNFHGGGVLMQPKIEIDGKQLKLIPLKLIHMKT